MLPKKYTFETKQTKSYRLIFNSVILLAFLLAFSISLCIYIPIHAKKVNERSKQDLFQKAPDLITIFTGDSGRINYGLQIAAEYPSAMVLISGVYTKNTLKTIIEKQEIDGIKEEELEEKTNFVRLDYQAKNTIENIIYTLKFMREKKNLNSILIVSSDYHILRIQLLLNAIRSHEENYRFHFYGIETKYDNWRNIKKLIMEIFKLARGVVLALLWEG